MNYNKPITISDLSDMKEVENVNEIGVGIPFLLLHKHKGQKATLKIMMEQLKPEELTKMLNQTNIKIQYWIKAKDGCVQLKGAHVVPDSSNLYVTPSDELIIKL